MVTVVERPLQAPVAPLNANARPPHSGDPAPVLQYFGAAGVAALHEALPPPAALQEDLPLLAGAAPPLALHEALPPAADGSVAPGVEPLPPPHATVEPMSIPATAETARVFARFIGSSSLRSFIGGALPRVFSATLRRGP